MRLAHKSVFTNVFTDPTQTKRSVTPLATECEEMKDMRKCGGNTMFPAGKNKFIFYLYPNAHPVWLRTIKEVMLNC
jgi:hypothetical protein